jgi:oligo-1,6-glucosidase/alpha-glucosidase
MAWDNSPNAGFSATEPWLPLHQDWRARNVAAQQAKPNSMLSLYRDLLKLRRAEQALSVGSIRLEKGSEHVLAYRREHGHCSLRILLNLSGAERRLPDGSESGELLLSTLGSQPPDGWLRPDEGLILRLDA